MRRPIRPFVTQFKTRPSRSSASRPSTNEDADKNISPPPFLDTAVFFAGQSTRGGGYEAALRAADELFGGISQRATVVETAPSSTEPVGKVLPSLIEADGSLSGRPVEAKQKPRRTHKTKAPALSRRANKQTLPAQSDKAPIPAVTAEAIIPSEPVIVPLARKERRSIQKRWVLKSELKAGETWKRRLCKAAR